MKSTRRVYDDPYEIDGKLIERMKDAFSAAYSNDLMLVSAVKKLLEINESDRPKF